MSHQRILEELKQVYDLLQNGLVKRDHYDSACKELVSKLVSNKTIRLSDRQQALKAAKQYCVSQAVLLEAGKQLLQLRMDNFRESAPDADAGPSRQQQQDQGVVGPSSSGGGPKASSESSPVSSFRDYGYEDSQDGTSIDEAESDAGTEVQDEAQRAQALFESWLKADPSAEQLLYDQEAKYALGLIDTPPAAGAGGAAAAAAAAAAAGTSSAGSDMDVDFLESENCTESEDSESGAAAAAAAAAATAEGAGANTGSQMRVDPTPAAAAAATRDGAGPSTAAATAAGDAAAAAAAFPEQQDGSGDESDADSELLSDPDTDDADEQTCRAADRQAMKEIRKYQRSSHTLMSRCAFKRVAEDALRSTTGGEEYSLEPLAVEALQRACESYLVDAFELSNEFAVHAGRQKLKQSDMHRAKRVSRFCSYLVG